MYSNYQFISNKTKYHRTIKKIIDLLPNPERKIVKMNVNITYVITPDNYCRCIYNSMTQMKKWNNFISYCSIL